MVNFQLASPSPSLSYKILSKGKKWCCRFYLNEYWTSKTLHPFANQGPSFVSGGWVLPIHAESTTFQYSWMCTHFLTIKGFCVMNSVYIIHYTEHSHTCFLWYPIINLSIQHLVPVEEQNISEIKGSSLFDVTRSHLIDCHIAIGMQNPGTYLFIVPWSNSGPRKSYSHLVISTVHVPYREGGMQPFLL